MKTNATAKISRRIDIKVPMLSLGREDFVFDARTTSDSKISTLKVSLGGVVWKGKGQRRHYTIPWETFDAVMQDYCNQMRFVPRS